MQKHQVNINQKIKQVLNSYKTNKNLNPILGLIKVSGKNKNKSSEKIDDIYYGK